MVDAAPFTATVTSDAVFPAAPELVFDDGTTWTATLEVEDFPKVATWAQSPVAVEALAATRPRRVTLRDPGSHHVYAHGTVYVSRVVDHGEAVATTGNLTGVTVDHLDGATHVTYQITGGAALTSASGGVLTFTTQEA